MPGIMISVVNNKGGVGKTTTCINLAHAFAMQDKRVLLVDMDAQCNTTGFFDMGNAQSSLYEFLENPKLNPLDCINPTPIGVSLLPNVENTAFLEAKLYETPKYYTILRDRLRPFACDTFDITLLDCPPSMGVFVMLSLIASDFVIVPIEAGSRMSLDGITKTILSINEIRTSQQNEALTLLKFLYNKANLKRTADYGAYEMLKMKYPDRVFETIIPDTTVIKQAEGRRMTVFQSNPKSSIAGKFRALAKEISKLITT